MPLNSLNDPNGYPEVVGAASATVRATMTEGAGKHTPGLWKKEGARHHLIHALAHIQAALDMPNDGQHDEGEEHLDHAVTRMSMAVWCRNMGID